MDTIEELRLTCSTIRFGSVCLSDDEKKFCDEWSKEILSSVKDLPESTQTDALLFLMKYSMTSFEDLNFFKMYYAPAWSIVYWLAESCQDTGKLNYQDVKNARAAHFMAMFLHALDDHLNDRQIPVTHLSLLLRSQSWGIMNDAARCLADGLDDGEEIIHNCIDEYYSSIRSEKISNSLDGYCEHFRKQMATWFIVPLVLAKKITGDEEFSRAIRSAYGSFGIAWRLLDDIQDLEVDMKNGVHSSIFVCLSEDMRKIWHAHTPQRASSGRRFLEPVWEHILENNIIGILKERISRELKSAVSIAGNCSLNGLANQLNCLLKPFT